jgi:asparagine synthase (glutamine-hydrolysing)
MLHKAARKAHERVRRATSPPAGGEILARKVVEHWRSNPALLDPVRPIGIFREAWIDQVLAGDVDPDLTAITLLTNLRVATESFAPTTSRNQ